MRVGRALPGELAAWRYGSQLISRRRTQIAVSAAGLLTAGVIVAGLPLIAGAMVPFTALQVGAQIHVQVHMHRQRRRVVHRIDPSNSPTGSELIVRRQHLYEAVLAAADEGGISVLLPMPEHPGKRPA